MIQVHVKIGLSGIDGPGLRRPVRERSNRVQGPFSGGISDKAISSVARRSFSYSVRGALSKGVFCVYPVRPMHESQRRPASSPISQSAVRYKCRQPWPIGPATRQKLPASASVNPYASRSRCDPEGQVWMDDCGTGIRRWWTQSWESQWDPSNPMSRFAVRLATSLG